ncbi:CapA family protein [Stigmatella aurantiaca]|uniref:CapA family protein n=1 Tax=Stigmatella aurantiaca (strain DW4/3-1) TaxID=378806 RepID=Q08Y80_STIAD|nr:CapA family protein [Stigmatella aurantiaca]ADO67953.1 CapA family protein [Stigmatella aurantiaca DW4/3-1]EAU65444.1 capsule biosynthesis protein CapA [Stigmatella aurantiaca DW4/3-1]
MFLSVLLLAPWVYAAPPAPARVELVFGGDVISHGDVQRTAADHARSTGPRQKGVPVPSLNHEGWDQLFGPIADVLRTADVAVVNLETPITDNPKAVTRELLFNAPPALAQALAAAGVRLVSTGNNHARDQHPTGMVETLQHLDAAGIRHVGTGASRGEAWEPVVMEVRGMRLGFVSFTRLLNGFSNPVRSELPHVALVPYERLGRPSGVAALLERVRQAAGQCDVLIVLVHWGAEYTAQPLPEDAALARALIDAGAGAVVGHHPHVLQPLEAYTTKDGRRGLIAYSLGNLVANQGRFYAHSPRGSGKAGDTRDSMLLRVSWLRHEPGGPVQLEEVAAMPVWIENNARTRRRKQRRFIQPVLIDREVETLEERLAALPGPLPLEKEAAKTRKRLEQRLALMKSRRERILKRLPEGVGVASPGLRLRSPSGAKQVAAQSIP